MLAYSFATSLLFGAVAVLNSFELTFFFNYPRTIHIILVDAQLDLFIWAASAISVSAVSLSYWKIRRRLTNLAPTFSAIVLAVALPILYQDGIWYWIVAYVLFVCTIIQLILEVRWKTQDNPDLANARPAIGLVLIYVLAYFLIIEASSAVYFVVRSFGDNPTVGRFDAGVELQFAYVTYALIPWLYVAFLFSWVWVPLVWRRIPRSRLFAQNEDQGLLAEPSSNGLRSILFDPRVMLALAVGVFIGFYPYFENPPWIVGTDGYWRYLAPLIGMSKKGTVGGGFVQALKERHPIPLMIIYAVQLALHTTAFEVLRYTPMFLIITLAFSTWWFLARKKGIGFGLVVFLLAILSVTTTVGFYSSILANWMALVVWVAFFAYICHRTDEKLRVRDFVLLFCMSTFILLLHPWTWGVFAATTALAAILALAKEKKGALNSAMLMLLVIAVDAVLALLSITLLPGSEGWRVQDALDLYTFVIRQPSNLTFFWSALTRLTEIWSPFFSALYLTLSILGVVYLGKTNLTPWRRHFILAWICVSGLGSVLVAPVGFDPARPTQTESQLWRLLYLTPFQLTAPLGIAWLTQFLNRLRPLPSENLGNSQGRANLLRGIWFSGLLVLGIVLSLLPSWARILLIPFPFVAILLLQRIGNVENGLLGDLILGLFLLIAFNSATRSVSLLLIDPHNYRP